MWETIGKALGTILTWGVNAIMWFIGGGWKPALVAITIILALILVIGFITSLKRR